MTKTEKRTKGQTDKILFEFVAAGTSLYQACKMQQKLIVDMLPGVPAIALPDYSLLIDAPYAATKALKKMETACLNAGKELAK